MLNLLRQNYVPLVVAALAAVVAARELNLDFSADPIEDSMSLPDDADIRVALWPEDANSYHIRNIRARFFRFDLQEAREILEEGLRHGLKAEEKLFYEYAYVLILMNARQNEIDEAVALWQHYYPTSIKTDPRLLNAVPFPSPMRAATTWKGTLSRDGRWYARSLSSGVVEVWDTQTGTANKVGRNVQFPIAFSLSANRLATVGDGPSLRLWDLKNMERTVDLKGHLAPVYAVAFSADEALCASGAADRTIRLWNTETGQLLRVVGKLDRTVSALCFSHDDSMLAAGSWNGKISIFHLATDRTFELHGHYGAISAVQFKADGASIVSASRDGTIRTWDIETGRVQQVFSPSGRTPVADVQISGDGLLVAGVSAGRTVNVWNSASGKLLSTNNTPAEPIGVAFRSDNRTLAVACTDHSVQFITAFSDLN